MRHAAAAHLHPWPDVVQGSVVVLRQRRRDRDQLAAPRGQHRPGQSRDRGAVVSAAEEQGRRLQIAPQTARHRLAQHLAVGPDIVGLVPPLVTGIGRGTPIDMRPQASVQAHRRHHGAGEAAYAFVLRRAQRDLRVHQHPASDLRLGKNAGNVRDRPEGLDLGGEDEHGRLQGMEQGALAHVVAAEHELALAGVPDGEGEVADEVLGASLPPSLVGGHDQGAVRRLG